MGYCTTSDYVERYSEEELIERTDRDGTGVVDDAVFGQASADADAEIDGYLGTRHALPLVSVPPLMVKLACDIVRYRLFADMVPEEVRRRYEDARRLLEAIAAGRVTLGLPTPAAQTGNLVLAEPGRKVFGGGLV